MAKDFFQNFIDDLGDPDTTLAAAGKSSAEFTGFVDSGSYAFNAALSGSLFNGFPNNKVLLLAGDPATGKTFFALSLVSDFLKANPEGKVFYFDTESAVTNQMMQDRGIDLKRVAKSEPATIEAFRNVVFKLLGKYEAIPIEKRFKLLIVLDSLSALPSAKEVADISEEKDTKDMTKAPVIKGLFRVLRLKMSQLQVPLIVTNHIYAVIGAYFPTKEMAGGSGAKYAADTIVFLSKSKEKDNEKHVIGNVVTCRLVKSRLTKEETKVQTRIMFDGGLDRYYGLLEMAVDAGVVRKGTKYEFPDGTKAFETSINKNPQKYFTDAVLKQLEDYVSKMFKYTGIGANVEDTENVEE